MYTCNPYGEPIAIKWVVTCETYYKKGYEPLVALLCSQSRHVRHKEQHSLCRDPGGSCLDCKPDMVNVLFQFGCYKAVAWHCSFYSLPRTTITC